MLKNRLLENSHKNKQASRIKKPVRSHKSSGLAPEEGGVKGLMSCHGRTETSVRADWLPSSALIPGMMSSMPSGGRQDPQGQASFGSDYLSGEGPGV